MSRDMPKSEKLQEAAMLALVTGQVQCDLSGNPNLHGLVVSLSRVSVYRAISSGVLVRVSKGTDKVPKRGTDKVRGRPKP